VPARTRHEVSRPVRVHVAAGVHRQPPLIGVVVAGQHHVNAVLHQQWPQLRHAGRDPLAADIEHRVMKEGDSTGTRVVRQVLYQPFILGCAGLGLVILGGRVYGDKMPACGIEAVVVGHIIPIVKIAGRFPVLVFMVPQGRVGDLAELAEILGALAVPVIELGHGPFVVNIAKIQDHVGVPTRHQVGDFRPFTARTVSGRRHDERLSGRRSRPHAGGKGVGIDRRGSNAVAEGQVD